MKRNVPVFYRRYLKLLTLCHYNQGDHRDDAFARLLFESMPAIGARLEALTLQFIRVFTEIGTNPPRSYDIQTGHYRSHSS